MTTPDQHAQVAGSWWASMAGWVYSIWHWFAAGAVWFKLRKPKQAQQDDPEMQTNGGGGRAVRR